MKYSLPTIIQRVLTTTVITIILVACQDFVQIDAPRTELVKSTVFTEDGTATAAVVALYSHLAQGFACGDNNSVSYYGALSSDELVNYYSAGASSDVVDVQQISDNTISPASARILRLWTDIYQLVYKTNAVLEGLEGSSIKEPLRTQLQGEALFIRSFCYWNLVNLYGDVPLAITTDYTINSSIPRSPVNEVYEQIVNDLTKAKQFLQNTYPSTNSERVRANKASVSAFLSRVYLYTHDWGCRGT